MPTVACEMSILDYCTRVPKPTAPPRPIKFDNLGRPSQRVVGQKAEVVRNPDNGKIVSVNPTSTKKAERLLRRLGSEK